MALSHAHPQPPEGAQLVSDEHAYHLVFAREQAANTDAIVKFIRQLMDGHAIEKEWEKKKGQDAYFQYADQVSNGLTQRKHHVSDMIRIESAPEDKSGGLEITIYKSTAIAKEQDLFKKEKARLAARQVHVPALDASGKDGAPLKLVVTDPKRANISGELAAQAINSVDDVVDMPATAGLALMSTAASGVGSANEVDPPAIAQEASMLVAEDAVDAGSADASSISTKDATPVVQETGTQFGLLSEYLHFGAIKDMPGDKYTEAPFDALACTLRHSYETVRAREIAVGTTLDTYIRDIVYGSDTAAKERLAHILHVSDIEALRKKSISEVIGSYKSQDIFGDKPIAATYDATIRAIQADASLPKLAIDASELSLIDTMADAYQALHSTAHNINMLSDIDPASFKQLDDATVRFNSVDRDSKKVTEVTVPLAQLTKVFVKNAIQKNIDVFGDFAFTDHLRRYQHMAKYHEQALRASALGIIHVSDMQYAWDHILEGEHLVLNKMPSKYGTHFPCRIDMERLSTVKGRSDLVEQGASMPKQADGLVTQLRSQLAFINRITNDTQHDKTQPLEDILDMVMSVKPDGRGHKKEDYPGDGLREGKLLFEGREIGFDFLSIRRAIDLATEAAKACDEKIHRDLEKFSQGNPLPATYVANASQTNLNRLRMNFKAILFSPLYAPCITLEQHYVVEKDMDVVEKDIVKPMFCVKRSGENEYSVTVNKQLLPLYLEQKQEILDNPEPLSSDQRIDHSMNFLRTELIKGALTHKDEMQEGINWAKSTARDKAEVLARLEGASPEGYAEWLQLKAEGKPVPDKKSYTIYQEKLTDAKWHAEKTRQGADDMVEFRNKAKLPDYKLLLAETQLIDELADAIEDCSSNGKVMRNTNDVMLKIHNPSPELKCTLEGLSDPSAGIADAIATLKQRIPSYSRVEKVKGPGKPTTVTTDMPGIELVCSKNPDANGNYTLTFTNVKKILRRGETEKVYYPILLAIQTEAGEVTPPISATYPQSQDLKLEHVPAALKDRVMELFKGTPMAEVALEQGRSSTATR